MNWRPRSFGANFETLFLGTEERRQVFEDYCMENSIEHHESCFKVSSHDEEMIVCRHDCKWRAAFYEFFQKGK